MTDATWIALGGVSLSGAVFIGTIIGTAWRLRGWLEIQFTKTQKAFSDTMMAHEAKDQSRHEENLERFTRIRVALARSGIDPNGHNGAASDHH